MKAAGILFYRVLEDNTVQLLLRNSKGKGFADLGGKIEDCDRDIYDIAAREAWEESNKVFDVNELQKKIRNQEGYYIVAAKYCMFYCEIGNHDTNEFGDTEIVTNQSHEFQWIGENDKFSCHVRLSTHFSEVMKDLHKYIEFQKTNPPGTRYLNDVDWNSVRAEWEHNREQAE